MTYLSEDERSQYGAVCLITGVTLFNSETGETKPADLFQLGTNYIVNAAGPWQPQRPLRSSEKVFSFSFNQDKHFVRRNVYVFPILSGWFNQAALDYIAKAPK